MPPLTLEERLLHVAEAKRKLNTQFQWICDSMNNDLKHALGDRPNSEFVVDPEGRIVVARQWSDPQALRGDLEKLIGVVPRPTSVADLDMKPLAPPKTAAKGIVPRLKLPTGMTPVFAKPIYSSNDEPFYVKLRAEVDDDYFRTGTGRLYIGMFPDPLYQVHWNNEAMPVIYEIESSDGVVVASEYGEGPEVDVKADADPREFLLDLCTDSENREPATFTIKVKYFACDDAETFCKPVSQTYQVVIERDRDGGSRRNSSSRGRRPQNNQIRNRGGQPSRGGFRLEPDHRQRGRHHGRPLKVFRGGGKEA